MQNLYKTNINAPTYELSKYRIRIILYNNYISIGVMFWKIHNITR